MGGQALPIQGQKDSLRISCEKKSSATNIFITPYRFKQQELEPARWSDNKKDFKKKLFLRFNCFYSCSSKSKATCFFNVFLKYLPTNLSLRYFLFSYINFN